ncbi:amino acid ABC transporter permease [Arthrobacter sp. N199823]|uniref:amino acid ABC transporter permease n=1 Tax=Arthrobacter sp. N199823 TaxID=2058895 RepID=UPI0015E290BE|nr:amino acid ABC transporter permease [Arthrobacter sp. N199823]
MSTAPTKLAPSATQAPESGAPSATQAPESGAPSATEAPEPASAQQRAVADYSGYRIVAAKHPWRWVGTVVVALGVAAILWSLITNPRWEWDVVAQWFTAESVIRGLGETLKLTVIAGALGFILGFILALMRLSASPLLASVSWTFSWIFRSTPLLVQMLLWYNLGYLYEKISLGIPFTSVTFFEVQTTTLVSQFAAAILGLTLNQAAYSAEIIRGGILSVDQGQIEAAAALGIPAWRRSTRIVLPQAMRSILPTAFNEIIGLVKGTSIVYVLAYSELFYTVQVIYNRTQQVLPLLLVATLWYIVITSVLSVFQYYIERHYAKGAVRTLPLTPLQKARKFFSLRTTAKDLS